MRKIWMKKTFAFSMIIVVLLGLFAFAPTFIASNAASPGGKLLIGEEPPLGGKASFIDKGSGAEYLFRLIASEWDNAGDGQVTMLLEGPSMSLCTASGPAAEVDFASADEGSDPFDNHYPGSNPLPDIACGTAYTMAVSIDGCQADIEFHGYVHSDYPLVTYMGMMTTDVSVKIGDTPEENKIKIKIYTPKEDIKLEGVFSGTYFLDTCP